MKKLLATLLTFALICSLFAACGSTQASSATAASEQSQEEAVSSAPAEAAADAEPTEETASEPEAEASAAEDTAAGEIPYQIPLCEETETLSLYFPWPAFLNNFIDSPADSLYYTTLEERLNVSIDFYIVDAETTTDTFNLMCAGGDITDMVVNGTSNYAGGADASVADDIFIDLSDQIETYAPHYYALLMENDGAYRSAITDSGLMPDIKSMNYELGRLEVGYQIREDWLTDLNLEKPKTLDQLHEVLTAFKEEKGADSALLLTQSASAGIIASAYGVTDNFYVEDGVVKFSPTDASYKDYIDYLHQLYDEELVSHDFMSLGDDPTTVDEYAPTGRSGIFSANISSMPTYESASTDPNIIVGATPNVLMDENEKSDRGYYPSWFSSGMSMSVSTCCENPELAIQWIDYGYTDEGAMLANYGVEGVTYTLDEDGNVQWTEYVNDNPDVPQSVRLLIDTAFMAAYHKDYSRDWMSYNERESAAADIWAEPYNGYSETYPYDYVTLTADESSLVASLWSDIDTYVTEYRMRVVAGYQTTDDYADYQASIDEMGIAQVLEVYQAAYDRFINR